MRKILNLAIALCMALLVSVSLQAQVISYDLASVPDAVKKDADMIKRYENIVFEVTDIDRATLTTHLVYTVLNENARRYLQFLEYIDKFRSLNDAEMKVYDASGRQTIRYRQKDMMTQAVGSGLVEDGKVVFANAATSSYPITIEIKYVTKFKGTLMYPSYDILEQNTGVEVSSFTAKVPKNLDLRFKEKNISLKPETGEEGNYKWYRWSVKNLAPMKYERGSVSPYPYVMLAPNKFKFDEYEGDLSTWKTFGIWYSSVYKGLDKLPPDRVAFFNGLVKEAPDTKEKIRILYNYLQKNFRYVSIQLGIGGMRPFSADFTDKKKYGDCKALSNFMKAALDAVGIKSYTAAINAGANALAMDNDFPSKFSNHVILCVPMGKDTVWLECTSNTNDFGVLGPFTENRNALLITENGGILVSTPASKYSDNVFSAHTIINLQDDGSGITVTNFKTAGEYKEIMKYYVDEKQDDQKEFIVHNLGFRQPDDFTYKLSDDPLKYTTKLETALEKVYDFKAGSKSFFKPRLYTFWSETLSPSVNRKQDYYFSFPRTLSDTTIFKLPGGATPDALPKEKDLQCAYASYKTKYWYNEAEKAVYSTATLELRQHKIPAAQYAGVKKFFDEVLLDDGQRIVVKE